MSVDIDGKALEGVEALLAANSSLYFYDKDPQQYGIYNILASKNIDREQKQRIVAKFIKKGLNADYEGEEGPLLTKLAENADENALEGIIALLSIDGYKPQKNAEEYGIKELLENEKLDSFQRAKLAYCCSKKETNGLDNIIPDEIQKDMGLLRSVDQGELDCEVEADVEL